MIKNLANVKQKLISIVKARNKTRLTKIGEECVQSIQTILDARYGSDSPLLDSIQYRILDDFNVEIFSDSKIAVFLEKGTKPHIIRPKNKKALAFRSLEKGPSGNSNYGDKIIVKEVKHPGFEARPFFDKGIFLGKQKLRGKL